jgi:hypothetical protein
LSDVESFQITARRRSFKVWLAFKSPVGYFNDGKHGRSKLLYSIIGIVVMLIPTTEKSLLRHDAQRRNRR